MGLCENLGEIGTAGLFTILGAIITIFGGYLLGYRKDIKVDNKKKERDIVQELREKLIAEKEDQTIHLSSIDIDRFSRLPGIDRSSLEAKLKEYKESNTPLPPPHGSSTNAASILAKSSSLSQKRARDKASAIDELINILDSLR